MKLLIMADASPARGSGHVMRSIALAQAAAAANAETYMLCRSTIEWVSERLGGESFPVAVTDDPIPPQDDPHTCLRRLRTISPPGAAVWVALDGYHFTLECQQAIRDAGYRLLVVDDYAHLPEYSCDFLINSSVCAGDFRYTGDIGCKLLGPEFAMLRQEFRAARAKALGYRCSKDVRNLLVSMGGGNFANRLGGLLSEFADLPSLRGKRIRVVKGAMQDEQIRDAFARIPEQPEILSSIADMPGLLLDTDLCITAGGSTCFELCCLGVPFLTAEIAENQHDGLMCLASAYGIPFAERGTLDLLLRDEAERSALRQRELTLADGDGAWRIISCLFQISARQDNQNGYQGKRN